MRDRPLMAGLRALVAAQDAKAAAREAAVAAATAAEVAREEALARAVPRRRVPAPAPAPSAELVAMRADPLARMLAEAFGGTVVAVETEILTPEQVAERDAEAAWRQTPEGREATERERQERIAAYHLEDRVAAARAEFNASPWAFASRRRNRDLMESTYSALMPSCDLLALSEHLIGNGWSWVFQSVGDGGQARKPIGGYAQSGGPNAKGHAFVPHHMAHDDMTPSTRCLTRTTEEQRSRWAHNIRKSHRKGTANVAIVTGPAASVIVVDNDCSDAARAAVADRVAEEVLGVTPYVRTRPGVPRNGRIYRATDEVFEVLRKTEVRWERDTPDQKKGDSVELLVKGACFTIHGRHHSSGAVFEWAGPLPGMDPGATPDLAPEVTVEQLRDYLARLRAECPGTAVAEKAARAGTGDGEVRVLADTTGMYVPTLEELAEAQHQISASGKVTAERRNYVYAAGLKIVAVNAHVSRLLQDLPDGTPVDQTTPEFLAAVKRLSDVVMKVVHRDVEEGDGVSYAAVEGGLHGQMVRAAQVYRRDLVRSGDAHVKAFGPARAGAEPVTLAAPLLHAEVKALQTMRDDTLRTLFPARTATKLPMTVVDGDGADRALLDADGMAAQRLRVAEEVRAPIMAWLEAVWDRAQNVRKVTKKEMKRLQRVASEVLLLKAPTGAGKTQTLLKCVFDIKQRRGFIGPILFMAPSYALLSDVSGRVEGIALEAEKAATDDAMRAAAAMGLKTMTYQGKSRLCTREEGALLAENGISLRNLCDGEVSEWDPETREWTKRPVSCHLKKVCRAWTQIAEIATCDVVFLPTAYVSLPCPAELKACHALVVDESVAGRFLRSDTLAIESLSLARRVPFVSKAEEERGYSDEVLMKDRRDVAEIVTAWAVRNAGKATPEDVGVLLLDGLPLPETPAADRDALAIERVESAGNCVGRGASTFRSINPETQPHEIVELLTGPVGTDVWGERHLYTVLADRMRALAADRHTAGIVAAARANGHTGTGPAKVARGAWDHRIQVTTGAPSTGKSGVQIRVSWRGKNSFAELPTLLMDASANELMIRKLWKGREVRTVTVAARLHMRVLAVLDRRFTDSSLTPWRHEAEPARHAAAHLATDVRAVVDTLSALQGNSQVFVASTKSIEVLLNTAYRPWANVSWLHYGACVGLDFAKHFPAGLIIGRQELPAGAVDQQVGALTYDDENPELPVDLLGTGVDAEGNRLHAPEVPRLLHLRSGRDLILRVPTYPSAWAAAVQAQAREEQLLQALGRLRPVYRDGEPPLAVLLGNIVPEGMLVDAVCEMKDLDLALGRQLRAGGGVRLAPQRPPFEAIADKAAREQAIAGWERPARGLVRVGYVREDGTGREVEVVAAEMPRLAELLERFEEAWLQAPPTGVREMSRGAPLSALKAREPDKKMVDLLGSPAEQDAAERAALARAAASPVVMLDRRGTAMTCRSGGVDVPRHLPVAVAAALASLSVRHEGNANAAPDEVEEVVEAAPEPVVRTVHDMLEGMDPLDAFAA